MGKKYILECCVDSPESAYNAVAGGVDRLELCGNLSIGGITPTLGLYREIRKFTEIEIRILVRPRFGDFCYTPKEIALMREDIRMYRKAGADGIVIGVTNPDGTLNEEAMEELISEADGGKITLHRAFDMCRDPKEALEAAIRLHMDTILTSGQRNDCMQGIETLTMLQQQAAGRIEIMAGGGVTAENITEIAKTTGIHTLHTSGKEILDSPMKYRNPFVSMGLKSLSEYELYRTSEQKIRQIRSLLDVI